MPESSRGTGQTLWDASPVPGSEAACPEHAGFLRRRRGGDTARALRGVGTPRAGEDSERRIISKRVPVLAPDSEPLMPMKALRARRCMKEGKVKTIRTKLVIFAVQLVEKSSGRERQPVVLGIDPGSKYTG